MPFPSCLISRGHEASCSASILFRSFLFWRAWRKHGPKVLDVLAEKYPQAFFAGMVAMTKVIRWETGADAASFSRTLTPDQIMDKLEERVGPEGRKLFEQFIRKVNILQAKQQLEAQAQMGVTERSGERGPV
jgi:hypothetical protein